MTKFSVLRDCVLPEVLGRWYTRKMNLKKEPVSGAGDCYCRRTSDEPTTSCSNPECPINFFPFGLSLHNYIMFQKHGYVNTAENYLNLFEMQKVPKSQPAQVFSKKRCYLMRSVCAK